MSCEEAHRGNMSELAQKVKKSIERIRSFESIANNHSDDGTQGFYLAFSGGKDSVALKALMDMAGVKCDAHYRLTSVDPPELVRFIKDKHPDVYIDKPRYSDDYKVERLQGKQITMWNLIPQKLMPPTRLVRYCCEYLKEDGGDGRFTVTGVRWAESVNRAKNQGVVTVTDKSAGREYGDDPNFQSTDRGGCGACKRQLGIKADAGRLRHQTQDLLKSDDRLDRRGSVGVYQKREHPVLFAL